MKMILLLATLFGFTSLYSQDSVFVLDKKGVVRNVHIGFTGKDKQIYKSEIEKYLNE